MSKNQSVTLVEVGLRDGLQNESVGLSVEDRIQLAQKLYAAGERRIELGAFVREEKVPQMAGTQKVVDFILNENLPRLQASVLVPNEAGMKRALQTKIKEVAIFTATSESFSKKNINCTIEESFVRFEPVLKLARENKIKVRGYLSTCFGCPYEGPVSEEKVVKIAKRLYKIGCYEISIGDTIGVANPGQVQSLFRKLKKAIPVKMLAGHFHDTRGLASANITAAFQLGIRTFDTSVGGLGGCPYAPGSAGNVATEDVAYLFSGWGVKTGLDLPQLIEINHWVGKLMNRQLPSKVGQAGLLHPLGKI